MMHLASHRNIGILYTAWILVSTLVVHNPWSFMCSHVISASCVHCA
jgi:hypothetical protein